MTASCVDGKTVWRLAELACARSHALLGNPPVGTVKGTRPEPARPAGYRLVMMRRSPFRGEQYDVWQAVDHEGEVLESIVTKTRDKNAAWKSIRKSSKRHGHAKETVTDRLA